MLNCYQQIDTLDELKDYIYTTLCDHCQLQAGAYEMTERILVRGGNPCGIFFCVHGPRATKFTAIWETQRNRVLFYGSDGERFQKTQLIEAPQLECAAA